MWVVREREGRERGRAPEGRGRRRVSGQVHVSCKEVRKVG